MLHTDAYVNEQLAALRTLRDVFAPALAIAQNDENKDTTRVAAHNEAKQAIGQAQAIVETLSDCPERFPHGLPILPHDLRYETDYNGALRAFDAVEEEILASLSA